MDERPILPDAALPAPHAGGARALAVAALAGLGSLAAHAALVGALILVEPAPAAIGAAEAEAIEVEIVAEAPADLAAPRPEPAPERLASVAAEAFVPPDVEPPADLPWLAPPAPVETARAEASPDAPPDAAPPLDEPQPIPPPSVEAATLLPPDPEAAPLQTETAAAPPPRARKPARGEPATAQPDPKPRIARRIAESRPPSRPAPTSRPAPAAEPRPAPARPQPAGDGGAAEIAAFRSLVARRIASEKRYPAGARERGQRGRPVVAFSLSPSGGLAGVSLARSSGHAELDAEILAMVRRAAPFPKPPPGAARAFSLAVSFDLR